MIKRLARFAVILGILAFVHQMIRIYLSLMRITMVNEMNEEMVINRLEKGQKRIAAIWH
jgi:hypothetical protein